MAGCDCARTILSMVMVTPPGRIWAVRWRRFVRRTRKSSTAWTTRFSRPAWHEHFRIPAARAQLPLRHHGPGGIGPALPGDDTEGHGGTARTHGPYGHHPHGGGVDGVRAWRQMGFQVARNQ